MAHPSNAAIMEPSQVLPLRPVPKIQTMFSGLTPCVSPGRDGRDCPRARERKDFTARRQARSNLGVNAVPPTPSGGRAGHKVIATIYSCKTNLRAVGHYTVNNAPVW